ncbi:MAG: hypothetical protein Q7S89_01810, partial [bacterium]|nr:hypothetical protein [bacterium]
FFLLVPGIILMVMFYFGWYIYLFEGQRGIAALRASRQLVRGFWWTVFARLLVLFVFTMLLTLPGYIPILGFFWNIAIQFVIGPVAALFTIHVWEELRALKKRNAEVNDGMSGGKKFGLGVVMALPFLFAALVGAGIAMSIYQGSTLKYERSLDETKMYDFPVDNGLPVFTPTPSE